jgi:hypothetical protein
MKAKLFCLAVMLPLSATPASADVMQLTVTGTVTSRTIRLLPDYSTIFSGPLSDTFVLSVRYDTSLGTYLSFSNWQGFTTEEKLYGDGPGSPPTLCGDVPVGFGKMLLFLSAIHGFAGNPRGQLHLQARPSMRSSAALWLLART